MYETHFSLPEMNIVNAVTEFAKNGFRTLAFASRRLESPEVDGVLTQEEIECQLTMAGVSSVEDLLQRDVAQCLRDFKEAGIRTWMLTGDKGDTAKMIGLQCGMLSQDHTNHVSKHINANPAIIPTVLRQINEDSNTDVIEEFNKLEEILQQGKRLELMVSGLKLV